MTNPGLPISRLVNVTVNLSPPAPQVENIDSCLIIGSSPVIDIVERMRTYDTIGEVATDFGINAPEYLAAVLWFEQNPAPSQILIGRWAQTATPAVLLGGPLPILAYTALTSITNGAFFILVNGMPLSVTGLNFSSITNLNGAASIIQTALQALLAGTMCVWNSVYEQFKILSPTTGVASTITWGATPDASGSFTFSGQPANLDTITLNGTAVTFVTGVPTGNQVLIGGTLSITLANLLTFLNGSVDVQISKFKFYVAGSVLYVASVVTGTGGNALTIAKTSSAITLSGASLAGGGGTDVSATLGLALASSGSYVANGIAAESALGAVLIFDNMFNNLWYGLVVLGASDSDHIAIANYIEADSVTRHYYGVSTQEAGVLVATDTSDIAYQLQQLGLNHTGVQYSSSNPYAVVSLLARILTTNWQANNSTITLMYKQEPGIVPENLSVTQVDALEAKNCNVFVAYNNNTAIIEMATSASGQFIDTIIGLDWFAIELQANWYAALYESPTKIPQTDPGMHILATIAENTCLEGVNNGLFAPGVWNSGGFGQISQGSYLAKGYYVYQPSVNSQPESIRQTRISVPFQIAVKLAGAVQTVDGTILVNA